MLNLSNTSNGISCTFFVIRLKTYLDTCTIGTDLAQWHINRSTCIRLQFSTTKRKS